MLVIVFGAIVAAWVPIWMAIVSIVVSLGLVSGIGQLVEFNLFVVNIISMIGLAVGIDYSLFIVSRYREERKKGFPKLEAIGASGATASRAVFFSGATVVLALMGMFILPTTIFRSLASGAIFVTLMSLLAAMTLLPACSRSSATGRTGRGCRGADGRSRSSLVLVSGLVGGLIGASGRRPRWSRSGRRAPSSGARCSSRGSCGAAPRGSCSGFAGMPRPATPIRVAASGID